MANNQNQPGFAPSARALAALTAGATVIGLMAIGWISIGKLRVFGRPLN